jgi:hypothetical protein
MKNKIVLLLVLLLVIPLVTANVETLGTFKKNDCVELKQTCGSCSLIKITSVLYPNSTIALGPTDMTTTDNIEWTYQFCSTNSLGEYIVNGYGDVDGVNTVWAYDFLVTENGGAEPSGIVIVFFAIIFLILVGGFGFLTIASLDGLKDMDFTIKEVLLNWAVFFILVAGYLLGKQYLGNAFINQFLEMTMKITAFTNVGLPLLVFMLSITVGDLKRRKAQFNQ